MSNPITTESLYDSQTRQISKLWEINENLRVEVEKQRKEIKKLKEALHDIASFANKHKEEQPSVQTLP